MRLLLSVFLNLRNDENEMYHAKGSSSAFYRFLFQDLH